MYGSFSDTLQRCKLWMWPEEEPTTTEVVTALPGDIKESTKPQGDITTRTRHAHDVKSAQHVVYFEGNEETPTHHKHKLDIYYPVRSNAPDGGGCCNPHNKTVVFIHGGGWARGDRNFLFGKNAHVGQSLASRGYTTAVISYRLSPACKHPEHAKDVARAIKWVYHNIGKYNGNPNKMFLCGESAGGHLASLVSLDPQYLQGEGIDPKIIKGVIGISGVYDIHMLAQNPLFLRMYVWPVFGTKQEEWQLASPINHVTSNAPPFLLFNAQFDFGLQHHTAKFQELLSSLKIPVSSMVFPWYSHLTIGLLFTRLVDTPMTREVMQFLAKYGNDIDSHTTTPTATATTTAATASTTAPPTALDLQT